jgi:myosin heavy subunit
MAIHPMQDNAAVLDLIEGRMGIVTFLNEECILPKGGDGPFTSKVKPRPIALMFSDSLLA